MSLESLEIHGALKSIEAELDRQKEKAAKFKKERNEARQRIERLETAVKVLRLSLIEMVEKGEGCLSERDDCEPDCCRYGNARAVLRGTAHVLV